MHFRVASFVDRFVGVVVDETVVWAFGIVVVSGLASYSAVVNHSSFPSAFEEFAAQVEEMLAFDVGDVNTLAARVVEPLSSVVGLACYSGSSSSAVAGLVAAGPELGPAPVVGLSVEVLPGSGVFVPIIVPIFDPPDVCRRPKIVCY